MNGYAPGVEKLVMHPGHVAKIIHREKCGPIHLSVWPTRKCQLKCSYCCVRKVKGGGELTLPSFMAAIDSLVTRGLLAVEFSGGGDPLLWGSINQAIDYCFLKGLRISLITNGLAIDVLSKESIRKLSWARVSIQSMPHLRSLDLTPLIRGCKTSLSLISQSSVRLQAVAKYCDDNKIVCRVTTPKPCEIDVDEQVKQYLRVIASKFMFFSDKERGAPKGCYMPWVRSAIDWQGNFLPCPAMHLNSDNAEIPDKFKLCKIEDITKWLDTNEPRDMGYRCEFCNCGKTNNDYLHSMINKSGEDYEFV